MDSKSPEAAELVKKEASDCLGRLVSIEAAIFESELLSANQCQESAGDCRHVSFFSPVKGDMVEFRFLHQQAMDP